MGDWLLSDPVETGRIVEAPAAIVVTRNAGDLGIHKTKSGKDLIRIPFYKKIYTYFFLHLHHDPIA